MPASLTGDSGTVGNYTYTAPNVGLGSDPDNLADIRLGFDARLLGDARSPFRLGAGAQLFIPSDSRANYDTDGRVRAMGRILFAGDQGIFTYAGQAGVHIRTLDDSPIPGSPQGSEFLFGIAGGVKIPVALRFMGLRLFDHLCKRGKQTRSGCSRLGLKARGVAAGRRV
jgi:hypothetical protein